MQKLIFFFAIVIMNHVYLLKNFQRIGGENISPVTRAFGWSLSRGLDVDDNHYPDFAVGAYDSDQAILLKYVT